MQDLKGKIKVAAAAMAGSLMLGATMAGAMAADLGMLPAPFVANNDLAGQIVVGANAAVPDVIASAQLAAAFGEYLVSASGGAGSAATGYKMEDMALNAVVSTGLGKTTFTDTDIAKLLDTTVSFRGDTYDVQEQIILGGSYPALMTGADSTSGIRDADTYGSSVGGKVYAIMAKQNLKYHYKFDDTLNATATSTLVDDDHPLGVKLLGQSISVVDVDPGDQITVQLGTAATLGEGQSVTVGGYSVTVDTIGSGSISMSISGSGCSDSDFVSELDTWETNCGEVDVYVEDILYLDAGESGNRVKIRAGEETTKTFKDGDEYIGEDDQDPEWVWDISTTGGVIDYLGVEYNWDLLSLDDNPITIGEQLTFPNDYVVLKLDSYTTDTRGDFDFKFDSSEDIYAAGTDSSPIAAYDNKPVFMVTGPSDDSFSDGTNEASKIVFSQLTAAADETFTIAYWDDDNNKFVNATVMLNASSSADTGWDLKYQDTTYNIYVQASADTYNISLRDGTYDVIMIALHDDTTGFDFLGTSDNEAEAKELWIGSEKIGTSESDVLTHFGTLIENPNNNGDSDKLSMTVPDEQVKAYVYLGAAGATIATGDVSYTYSGLNAEVAVLDSEADTSGATPLVVVGGPYANALAASLIGTVDADIEDFFGYDATAGSGKGVVKLYDAGETPWSVEAMIVAGWAAKDTRAAAYILGQYLTGVKSLSALDSKSSITVTATSATSISSEELA